VTSGPITTVVLAAGPSTRLGRPKQLVSVDGVTLVARAARAALDAGLGPVLVVVGAGAPDVVAAVRGLDVACVTNRRWDEGLGTSVAAGVAAAAEDPACVAVILLPCDMPAVTSAHLAALAQTWRSGPGTPVGSAYAGTIGTPAVFGRRDFVALAGLDGAHGARSLLAGAGSVPCEECATDIDTPADLDGR
jgi:molybdenum cofactor cytidylyltransferase